MESRIGKTGLVYDLRMTEHRCLWNDGYPECPDRFTKILNRCNELKLIERCHSIPSRPATLNEILLKHTQEHFDLLKATDGETNEQKLEEMCTHYDIFIHPSTFELSLLAVGCAIELVDKILLGEVQNGMAVIRPPGHHAMETRFDGFCFFNNVAIAAQHAINNYNMKRILIVDFDVHHGQGTQQLFYDDPRVLYFSIHRYDYGTFFPGLRESDFDFIGEGKGKGFNFNVALNKGGMTNADYLAIWQQILLPVAIEFQPELVLISAGYDAAYGCALGEMEITPACYAHLIAPLMSLAEGKVAAFLEGGYQLESLAESAAITLKTFLGDPCPLLETLDEPCNSLQESILNCTHSHKAFWKCLQVHQEYSPEALHRDHSNIHQVIQKFLDDTELNPWYNKQHYDTRIDFPNQIRSKEEDAKISEHLQYLKRITNLDKPLNRTFFSCFEKTGSREKAKQFLLKNDLLHRLHEPVKSISEAEPNPSKSKNETTLEVVRNVLENKYLNGVFVELGEASVDDNASLASQFSILNGKRVLIVDFGGKQLQVLDKRLSESGKVLYMSLNLSDVEDIAGSEKFNINISMNKATVNDSDYVAAFQRIVLPIAYEFNPEVVFVSAAFETFSESIKSANLSPAIFGYLINWLSALANGKLILFSTEDNVATSICIKTLLRDPLPVLQIETNSSIGNIGTLRKVLSVQEKFWKSLKFNKILPTAE